MIRRPEKTVGDNETFVTLIRVAQEKPEVRKTFGGILRQSPFHRQTMLNTLIEEMKLKGALADVVSAISALLNDDVADRAMEMIQG